MSSSLDSKDRLKERAQLREQRERDRLEREKERLARQERLQRAANQSAAAQAAAAASSSSSSSVPPARSPKEDPSPTTASASASTSAASPDSDADSDADPSDDAATSAEKKKEQQQRIVQMWKDKTKKTVKTGGPLRFKTGFRNTILDVFRARGWKETESETDWDILWTGKEWIRTIYDKIHLEQHQRVNHFRNFYELTRKDLLIKNLKRAKRAAASAAAAQAAQTAATQGGNRKGSVVSEDDGGSVGGQYDFFPDTYCLPAEYSLFVEAFKKSPGSSWIMKPIGSSQGKGIFLFERLSQISEWKNSYTWKPEEAKAEKYIVQRYLSDPLLIGGKKFDLRIYVLVTSYQPLTCYLYREGFARFSSTRFTMVKGDLSNAYVHLTNVAIQKKGEDYDAESGGKWDVRSLKLYLLEKYGVERTNQLFVDIQLICINSLLSVQKVIISDKHSFELYGYDILIDADLKPWLIEVNASPSLTANTPADYAMKLDLLNDTITVVDMEKRLTGLEDQVGGFDLIYRNGFVKFNPNCTFTTYLGAHNNREKQLKRMWKQIKKKKVEQAQQNQQATAQQAAGAQNAQ